jgi:hypothetical protein
LLPAWTRRPVQNVRGQYAFAGFACAGTAGNLEAVLDRGDRGAAITVTAASVSVRGWGYGLPATM